MKLDLGVGYLVKEWSEIVNKRYLKEDLISSMTVACIAIPLSLAIALASGVPPSVGLITAIIAGIVCAFFGGTKLAVSGPAAAMSVLIASNVEQFGLGGLLIIGIICGVLQILCGIIGFGTFMRYIPVPVISGFTAGIGAIILIGQLPRALGLPPPDQAHIIEVVKHLGSLVHQTNIFALILAVTAFCIMKFLPNIFPKLPAPLLAIIIPAIVVAFVPGVNVALIGEIPKTLPLPSFPSIQIENISKLFIAALSIFFLASLESLLSSSAADKMSKNKHDSNQELIGQGIGNLSVSLFGGIPISSVIVRTALNINAGAKTRRSSIFHSIILIACVYFFSTIIEKIPIAALAGILIAVAVKMLDVKSFISLFKVSKPDAYVYLITFFTILLVDLIVGVQAGFVAAAIIAFIQIAKTHFLFDKFEKSAGPIRCSLEGSLTFASSGKIEKLEEHLASYAIGKKAVIDVTKITTMDISGGALIAELLYTLKALNVEIILKGLSKKHEKLIMENIDEKVLPCTVAVSEEEVLQHHTPIFNLRAIKERIIHGTQLFQKDESHRDKSLFEKLALTQHPHTLFITCSDSRLNPNTITRTEFGELFIVRNVGNAIPHYQHGEQSVHSESAAIEFALKYLNVKNVIICGHAACGAVAARYNKIKNAEQHYSENIDKWLNFLDVGHINADSHEPLMTAAQNNVLNQMRTLKTYPIVQERLHNKHLSIFGWYYEISSKEILVYSEQTKHFMPISKLRQEWDTEEQEHIALIPTFIEK